MAKVKSLPLLPARVAHSRLVQNPAVLLAINWWFQGLRGMGRREASFRLGSEVLLLAAATALLEAAGVAMPSALALAALTVHSLYFACFGQLWVCARYAACWSRDPGVVADFTRRLLRELRARQDLEEVVIIGSLGRRGLCPGPRSDVDLRLVFPPGTRAWLVVNLLLMRLRFRAFRAAIPLDLYAYDDIEALARFDPAEPWLVVLDRRGRIHARFAATRRLLPWPEK